MHWKISTFVSGWQLSVSWWLRISVWLFIDWRCTTKTEKKVSQSSCLRVTQEKRSLLCYLRGNCAVTNETLHRVGVRDNLNGTTCDLIKTPPHIQRSLSDIRRCATSADGFHHFCSRSPVHRASFFLFRCYASPYGRLGCPLRWD